MKKSLPIGCLFWPQHEGLSSTCFFRQNGCPLRMLSEKELQVLPQAQRWVAISRPLSVTAMSFSSADAPSHSQ